LLALIPKVGSSMVGRVRTFALVAAVTVVATHLFPEAVRALGATAILLLVMGLVIPAWTEALVQRLTPGPRPGPDPTEPSDGPRREHEHGHPHAHGADSRLASEIAFAGLLLHHLGDGVALFTYAATADVVLSLAAHTVPLIAVLVLRYSEILGRAAAIGRAVLLLAAMIAGSALAGVVPTEMIDRANPWIAAIVSGLLLHVIAHDLEADPPATPAARSLDLFAAALGIAVPLYGGLDGGSRAIAAFGARFSAASPALLLGLAAGALLLPRIVRLSRDSALAFAEPALSMDALFLALRFSGVALALSWFGLSNACALAGGRALGASREESGEPTPSTQPYATRARALFHRVGPWMIAGCFLSSYVAEAVPASEIEALRAPSFALLLATLLLLAIDVAPAALMPVAAAIIQKGASFGAALACVVLGSIASVPRISGLARAHGAPRAWLATLAIVAIAWAAGSTLDAVGLVIEPRALDEPSILEIAAAVVLAVFYLSEVWRRGARGFIAGLVRSPLP
jgi:hypothetical protein